MTTQEFINCFKPCQEARDWRLKNASSIEEAWQKTDSLDWMLWAAMKSDLKYVVLKEILLPIKHLMTDPRSLAVLEALDNPHQADWKSVRKNAAYTAATAAAATAYTAATAVAYAAAAYAATAAAAYAAAAATAATAATYAEDAVASSNYMKNLMLTLKTLTPRWNI